MVGTIFQILVIVIGWFVFKSINLPILEYVFAIVVGILICLIEEVKRKDDVGN